MSSLNLQQANSRSFQQQREVDAQNPQYGADAHAGEPLAAPTPTRASVGPHTSMWKPEAGIRFGGGPSTASNNRPMNGPPQDARWDPTQGLKFGYDDYIPIIFKYFEERKFNSKYFEMKE